MGCAKLETQHYGENKGQMERYGKNKYIVTEECFTYFFVYKRKMRILMFVYFEIREH